MDTYTHTTYSKIPVEDQTDRLRELCEALGIEIEEDYLYSEDGGIEGYLEDDTYVSEDDLFQEFQEIIKNSPLNFITMERAYTNYGTFPHDFGGTAAVITAGEVKRLSTQEWIISQTQGGVL